MSFSGDRDYRDSLLRSHFADDSEAGDSRNSFAQDRLNDSPRKPLDQVATGPLQPFTIDGSNLKGSGSLLSIFKSSIRIYFHQQQTNSTSRLWPKLKPFLRRTLSRHLRFSNFVLYLVIGCLSILGLIHVVGNVLDALEVRLPDSIDWVLSHWGQAGELTEGFGQWPTDATGDVHPVQCHSHNDYWRSVPLYAAVHAGCTSVEADVWLIDNELYVGHKRDALTADRTLINLYISPLLDLIGKQNPPDKHQSDEDYSPRLPQDLPFNGVFDVDPTQTFVLLIDFKTSGPALWPQLDAQLTPFRKKGYLTFFNGTGIVERPITIVVTGNAPFDLLTANDTYRDVFFDAPLHELADLSSPWPNPNRAQDSTRGHVQPKPDPPASNIVEGRVSTTSTMLEDRSQGRPGTLTFNNASIYSPFNSYYASTSFTKSIGHVWGSRLTQKQLQLIRGHIRGAHQRGLRVRYWSLPQWPIGLRNHVWHILIREGVDMLSVDDLRDATGRDWRRKKGLWN
ncbi:uncharacterized protein RSE6_09030 [Rhynchosporium secalis]|uniref:Altered inheritance of mitochondria protein 6 n=1 Tax=Rhynchosporium secalis TaxID=38038 RepID=A0A1E1MGW8_RHYSE|nr:uncharacterized protein RSE6_09030 [Rhynchosporium secalis]